MDENVTYESVLEPVLERSSPTETQADGGGGSDGSGWSDGRGGSMFAESDSSPLEFFLSNTGDASKDMAAAMAQPADEPVNPLDKLAKFFRENATLGKGLIAGGAGMLKSLSQQSALEEQRDWMEKQASEAQKRKDVRSRYASHTPTGLLAGAMQRKS